MSRALRTALLAALLAACQADPRPRPPPGDPCLGVTCAGAQVCVNGTCEGPPDPCAGVTCTGGKVCVAGVCQDPPDPCAGVTCAGGKVCVAGVCQDPPDPCAGVTCTGGKVCVAGVCQDPPDPCAGVTCTGGKVCVLGVCQDPPDPCAGVTCTGNDVCVAGVCVPVASTPTDVAPGAVSGHWTVAGSPYRVHGDIVVPKGAALTIDPGVRVEFQGPHRMSLRGRLSAVGTAAARVVFTTSAADRARGDAWVGWLGIRIDGSEYDTDTASDPVDHGAGIWELRFCEIAYVDKSSGVQQHPWKEAVGSFYGHGFHAADLVFDDNWLHHGRSGMLSLYPGSMSGASFGGVGTYRRNVLEDGRPGPAFDVAHVYSPIGTPGALHFVGGAVRRMTTVNDATVAFTWDSPVYLDGVEIVDCGDREAAPWFEAVNAGAEVIYTPP